MIEGSFIHQNLQVFSQAVNALVPAGIHAIN
jgi:hypothetical protein